MFYPSESNVSLFSFNIVALLPSCGTDFLTNSLPRCWLHLFADGVHLFILNITSIFYCYADLFVYLLTFLFHSPRFIFLNTAYFQSQQEIIIKGLANSRTFQRFALRTHTQIQDVKKVGTETLESHLDELHKAVLRNQHANFSTAAASNAKIPPTPPLRGFAGFISAFFKEIRHDLGFHQKK